MLLQAVITGGSLRSLLCGPAQGCHRPGVRASNGAGCWAKRDWEASPARFQGNGCWVIGRRAVLPGGKEGRENGFHTELSGIAPGAGAPNGHQRGQGMDLGSPRATLR